MIYNLRRDKTGIPEPLKTSTLSDQGWQEKDLENYLFHHLPGVVGNDLMVIGQSSPFEETVDLVALDREGGLWLFELKKVGGTQENLLQVLRYSQLFSQATVDDLDRIHQKFKKGKVEHSLAVEFCQYFGYDTNKAAGWADIIGQKHHLVVVTDGTDDATQAAINHWQQHGVDIQAWPYRVYEGDGENFRLDLPELTVRGCRVSRRPAGVFVVNTSRLKKKTSDKEDFMLKHGCALVTEEPWIRKIFNIPTGSRVMLYANEVGIIATGIATGERRMGELEGERSHYVRLRDFKKLKTPFTNAQIQEAAQKSYRYQAVMQLHGEAGPKVWEAVAAQG